MVQGQPTVAPYAPLMAGPAIITQELVAEIGLFQPKLKLTQKSPKLTPRPDQHPGIRATRMSQVGS